MCTPIQALDHKSQGSCENIYEKVGKVMAFTNDVSVDFHLVVLLSQGEGFIVTFGQDQKLDGGSIVTKL